MLNILTNFLISLLQVLGWIFRKWDVEVSTGLGWLKIETGGGKL
jgi:hypothetical protein